MRIFIAHHDTQKRMDLQNRLSRQSVTRCVNGTDNLQTAYNHIEHRQPDILLVSEQLAYQAEFKLLAKLCNLLNIAHYVLGPQLRGKWPMLQINQPDADIIRALQKTPLISPVAQQKFHPKHMLLIGASTGGVDALNKVIASFPVNCPPTLIVQHMGSKFTRGFVNLLNSSTAANVKLAEDGEVLQAGTIYMPGGDTHHLCLGKCIKPRIMLNTDAEISGHRPSIDALFLSAIRYANNITAAILTGMGKDGTQGIKALRQNGATTIGQDRATSVVYGMPRIAHEIGGITQQLPINAIGPALLQSAKADVSLTA